MEDLYMEVINECLKRNYTSNTEEMLSQINDFKHFLTYCEDNLLGTDISLVESRVTKYLEEC